ncbi:MAG: hypothetical protein ACKPJD_23665, partial [Planctomycetaceae bacterium]
MIIPKGIGWEQAKPVEIEEFRWSDQLSVISCQTTDHQSSPRLRETGERGRGWPDETALILGDSSSIEIQNLLRSNDE